MHAIVSRKMMVVRCRRTVVRSGITRCSAEHTLNTFSRSRFKARYILRDRGMSIKSADVSGFYTVAAGSSVMGSLKDHNADHFDQAAKTWDEKPLVVEVAEGIAHKLMEKLELEGKVLLDLGAGTGLVAQRLASKAKQVVGVDLSSGMINALNSKREAVPNMVGLCVDISDEDAFAAAIKGQNIADAFDVAYVHMALHHIDDAEGILKRMASLTKSGGFVAVSDILKTEKSNTFHGVHKHGETVHNTVAHAGGFEPSLITQLMENAGLVNVDITPSAVLMKREHEDTSGEKVLTEHPIFLAIAQKQ